MTPPIFTEKDKACLAPFLDGEVPAPATSFEARVILERAATAANQNDPDEKLLAAAFLVWADRIDPPGGPASRRRH